jgi:hypothetical protein
MPEYARRMARAIQMAVLNIDSMIERVASVGCPKRVAMLECRDAA